MVSMSDGTRLATDYYLPSAGGPEFPVVLVRTYYDKNALADFGSYYTTYLGYACIIQDVRGRFASEGLSSGWADDAWGANQDGAETIGWVLAQPWCNGKIATTGGSALGITQLLTAGASSDIACQSIWVGASDLYHQLAYQGGVFRKSLVENWANANGEPQVITLYKSHATKDAFWDGQDADTRAPIVTAPGMHIGGWFDIFQLGTINGFLKRQHSGGLGAQSNQKLIIGPWTHSLNTQPVGDFTFPANQTFDMFAYESRLFEYWVKGVDNGVMNEPAVQYYVMGEVGSSYAPGNEWRTAADWPPFPTVATPFYLDAAGGLGVEAPTVTQEGLSYAYDPSDPCPTVGGLNLTIPAGPRDQRAVSSRLDVLTFVTAPLSSPVEVTGNVRVALYVSTDAPDTDFTAKLVDVYPDGREMVMVDGIQRVKFRNGFETPDPLAPGEVGVLDIDLWYISLIFNKYHRIGLQVSSSNYPRFEVNPNNGDDFPGGHPSQIAQNTVWTGNAYPSALILPLQDANVEFAPMPGYSTVVGVALIVALMFVAYVSFQRFRA